jgi:hypothetical protein
MIEILNNHGPVYTSRRRFWSMGNEYLIYPDRLELRVPFLLSTFVIKREELIDINIYKPPVLRTTLWALKLDFADLFEHVGIIRKNGFMKKLRFTPENPREFVRKVEEIILRK